MVSASGEVVQLNIFLLGRRSNHHFVLELYDARKIASKIEKNYKVQYEVQQKERDNSPKKEQKKKQNENVFKLLLLQSNGKKTRKKKCK